MSEERTPLSDEGLQALVDNEFSPEEGAELLARVRADGDLRQRACELRMLKDTVRLAYREVPPPPRSWGGAVRGHRWWPSIAAAVLMLIVGLAVGWELHWASAPADRFAVLDPQGHGAAPARAENKELRIVFHLTNPDMTVAGELLDEVEAMLEQHEESRQPLRVEIVAHGEGLDLLRAKLSAHQEKIRALAEKYHNLTFVACKNTIERLRVEQGVEVVLLPQAHLATSGVDHVARRQQEGWVYIRV